MTGVGRAVRPEGRAVVVAGQAMILAEGEK
jgi:hypothetical protein